MRWSILNNHRCNWHDKTLCRLEGVDRRFWNLTTNQNFRLGNYGTCAQLFRTSASRNFRTIHRSSKTSTPRVPTQTKLLDVFSTCTHKHIQTRHIEWKSKYYNSKHKRHKRFVSPKFRFPLELYSPLRWRWATHKAHDRSGSLSIAL